MMKRIFSIAVVMLSAMCAFAQVADPVLMRINGKEVKRSEFEYALNKNNEMQGVDRKAVKEYLPMYIDFKLKVAEAEAMHLDTLSTFLEEFKNNRAQLAENYLIDHDYIEREAHKIYAKDSAVIDGFLKVAHVFVPIKQQDSADKADSLKAVMDKAYEAIMAGSSLADAAKAIGVPVNSVEPFEIIRGQAYKEFEEVAFALADSAISKPFRSPVGFHIVQRFGMRPFGEYREYREVIISMLEKRGIRNVARLLKGRHLAQEMGGNMTPEAALAREDSLLETKYPEFGNLMTEYYDGLLFFEVSSREVWNKASEDEAGLTKFFKKNKKKYKFETPRYRGAVIYANNAEDVEKAKKLFANAPQDEYRQIMKDNFYVDSVFTIRIEMGIFSIGDNAWVDKMVFGQGEGGKMKRGFTIVDIAGTLLKGPETYKDVKGHVINDYQKYLEERWLKALRKKYKVEVDDEVLKTVNNHN